MARRYDLWKEKIKSKYGFGPEAITDGSRRDFVIGGTIALGGVWLAACRAATGVPTEPSNTPEPHEARVPYKILDTTLSRGDITFLVMSVPIFGTKGELTDSRQAVMVAFLPDPNASEDFQVNFQIAVPQQENPFGAGYRLSTPRVPEDVEFPTASGELPKSTSQYIQGSLHTIYLEYSQELADKGLKLEVNGVVPQVLLVSEGEQQRFDPGGILT